MTRGLQLAILPGILGLLCVGFGGADLIDSYQSARWPTCEGVITVSRYELARGAVRSSTGRRRYTREYTVDIAYEYLAQGVARAGTRVSFREPATYGEREAQALTARYPVGRRLAVHFDPGAPAQSVLDPGANWRAVPFVLVGCLLIAAAVWLAGRADAEAARRPARRAIPADEFWPDAPIK